jgi:hypothetical protein
MMRDVTDRSDPNEREPVEKLVEEAKVENPDTTTARETFELELMEEGRSKEGESVTLADDADHQS